MKWFGASAASSRLLHLAVGRKMSAASSGATACDSSGSSPSAAAMFIDRTEPMEARRSWLYARPCCCWKPRAARSRSSCAASVRSDWPPALAAASAASAAGASPVSSGATGGGGGSAAAAAAAKSGGDAMDDAVCVSFAARASERR